MQFSKAETLLTMVSLPSEDRYGAISISTHYRICRWATFDQFVFLLLHFSKDTDKYLFLG